MPPPRLSRLELQVMEVLWTAGPSAIRAIQAAFPAKTRPAYTTVQTLVYRLEAKKALRRTGKVGNAHVFEPLIGRDAAMARLADDFLALFGGRAQPALACLIEAGNLTPRDLAEAEALLRERKTRPKAP